MKNSILLLFLSFILSSCFTYKEVELGDVKSIGLNKVSGDGIEIQADIQISNPNNYKVKVKKIEADVLLNNKKVGAITLSKKVVLPKKSNETHAFIANTKLSNVISAVPSLILGGSATLQMKGYIQGKASIFTRKFPIDIEKKISAKDFDL